MRCCLLFLLASCTVGAAPPRDAVELVGPMQEMVPDEQDAVAEVRQGVVRASARADDVLARLQEIDPGERRPVIHRERLTEPAQVDGLKASGLEIDTSVQLDSAAAAPPG